MLKIKETDLPVILSFEDYIEIMGKPNPKMKDTDNEIIAKWCKQATDQFDSMISSHNQNGALYTFWNNLKDTQEDRIRGYKLQCAIAKWVECFIISGKFWVDHVPTMSSNVSYNIESSSSDANVELKRKDIIKDLNSIGLLKTSNISDDNINETQLENDVEDLIIVSKDYLHYNFLCLDSQNWNQTLRSNINFANRGIFNGGAIIGNRDGENLPELRNYILKDCLIEGSFDKNWNDKYPYEVGDIVILVYAKPKVMELEEEAPPNSEDLIMSHFLCLKDNTNVYPLDDTTGCWEKLEIGEVDINQVVNVVYDKVVVKYDADFQEFIASMDIKWNDLELTFDNKFNNLAFDIDSQLVDFKQQIKNVYIPQELDKLPTIDQVIYHKGQTYQFKSIEEWEAIKTKYNIQDSDFVVNENNPLNVANVGKWDGTYFNGKKVYRYFTDNIKPYVSNVGQYVIWPHQQYQILDLSLVCDKLMPTVTETTTNDLSQWDFYIDRRDQINTALVLGQRRSGYYNENNSLRLNITYIKNGEDVEEVAPFYSQFYTVTFLVDITKKALIEVNEEIRYHEVTIQDNSQSHNFDRTITLTDYTNKDTPKSQKIYVENNGDTNQVIPLNGVLADYVAWNGEYYRQDAVSPMRKIYCFTKNFALVVASNEVKELECLYDCDKLIDVNFDIDNASGEFSYKVYPCPNGISVYLDKLNSAWMVKNNTPNTMKLTNINVKFLRKGE